LIILRLVFIIILIAAYRKRLLLGFAFTGASAAILFLLLPSTSPIWPISALLAMLANVGFGASVVAMNAYLPILARESEEVINADVGPSTQPPTDIPIVPTSTLDDESLAAPLLPDDNEEAESGQKTGQSDYNIALSKATARISSQGIALGYAAGIALLLLTLVPVTMLKGSTFALRLAIGASGIWWALGSLPAALWLPSSEEMKNAQQGRTEDAAWNEESTADGQDLRIADEIKTAWKTLILTFRPEEIRKLGNTFKYLAAWFLLSDGAD
jgi:UMF1 family MFS transporter